VRLTAADGYTAQRSYSIQGVLPLPLSALRSTLPVFKNPANKHKAVSLTVEQFRYAFGNAVSGQESTSSMNAGRSPHQASLCSRPPPTSIRTHRPRSTPPMIYCT
jgi:hypothetical protein